jgi:acetyl esterase/lipase
MMSGGLASAVVALGGLGLWRHNVTLAQARAAVVGVDPELLPWALQVAGSPPHGFSDAMLPKLRAGMERYSAPRETDVPWREVKIPGLPGQPPVTAFVINARPGGHRPGIVHTHGGGFFSGRAHYAVGEMQRLARALDTTIVTVDYRLAPETRFSGAVADGYAALQWLHAQGEALGVDRARIAVMGESAGGGLAALLAIAARDRGEVPLAFQCLTYPMLDDRTGTTRAAPAGHGVFMWTADANRYGWRSFLGLEPGGAGVPAAGVPMRCADLAGLPPAWIGVGSIDLFATEDKEYADRLNKAGVRTRFEEVPGAFHGFDMIAPETKIARRFAASRLAALKQALG